MSQRRLRCSSRCCWHWYTVEVGNSSLSYSPMTHAYKHRNDDNNLGRLCRALYLYSTKAQTCLAGA